MRQWAEWEEEEIAPLAIVRVDALAEPLADTEEVTESSLTAEGEWVADEDPGDGAHEEVHRIFHTDGPGKT